jgi:hypothetical protein
MFHRLLLLFWTSQLIHNLVKNSYSNSFDGCTGESAFDAYSGPISAIEAFQRFCGWDGVQDYFCGDINLSLFDTSDNGLNIILDGIQVTLGAATSSTDYAGDSDAGKATCSGLEFTPGLNGVATVMTWENVAVTHCR